jgi:glycosyltransferase involved in cell wall biosynthesis
VTLFDGIPALPPAAWRRFSPGARRRWLAPGVHERSPVMKEKLKVLFVASDTEGCGYARCRVPALGLGTLPGIEAKATATLGWDDLLHHDVIVWSRQHRRDLVRVRTFARGMGKLLVFDIDDYLHGLPSWNPASRHYPKGGPELRGLHEWMRACDGLIVSTPPLARAYGAYNENVAVLPNSLDLEAWRRRESGGGGVRLGWVGSVTHGKDLQGIKPALKKILRAHPGVRLVMMGYDGGFRREGLDVEFHPFVPIDEYPAKLASLRLDVALAPLSPHAFNRYKSNIKYLEYSALAVPCVASRIDPYAEIRHGETGFLATEEGEWIESVSALISDASLRRRVGDAARAYVAAGFDVRRTASLWAGWFRDLIASRPRRGEAVPGAPLLGQMHLLRGIEAARNGSGPEALGHLRRAALADPLNAAVRLLLAELLAASGDLDAARDEAMNAVDLSKEDPSIRGRAERLLEGFGRGAVEPDAGRPTVPAPRPR